MKILVIGGTQFVGRAMAQAALERGHDVTLFNRGKTGADLFATGKLTAEKIIGDRDGGLDVLEGRSWDAVIDSCGYYPRLVRDSAQKLKDSVGIYAFISTISVYSDNSKVGTAENDLMSRDVGDPTVEEMTGETYGPFKALCEDEVLAVFPNRHVVIRPGLVTGPNDHTNRFGYWPARIAKGGDVLIPGSPDRQLQHIDARDLAAFTLHCIEHEIIGDFNATGPDAIQTMGELVSACLDASGSRANPIYVDETFLLENEVQPWSELPFWIPTTDPQMAGFFTFNTQKAIDAGLTFRPLGETVRDALVYENERAQAADFHNWSANLSPQKESELLEKWASR
ncbi:MAG: 2'-hydroxyisoflavone reductase [Cellvibrionaceae bacterium]|jgi:2'-hydroxyisoflavone reductase